jgi:hypothetical protein
LKRPAAILIYSGADLEEIRSIISPDYWQNILHYQLDSSAWNPNVRHKVKRWIRNHKLETTDSNLFFSDDMNWRDQLLRHYLNGQGHFLLEDGLGSYYEASLTPTQWLFRNLVLRSLYFDLDIHFGAVSQSSAQMYYCLHKTGFPWIKNRQIVQLVGVNLEQYLDSLQENGNTNMENCSDYDLVFLTQPLYESRLLSKQQDLWYHRQLLGCFRNTATSILVKKHPRETMEMFRKRVDTMESSLPGATVRATTNSTPAEALLGRMDDKTKVVSFTSTALVNFKRLRPNLDVYFCPISDNMAISSIFEDIGISRISITPGTKENPTNVITKRQN